jgi:hypothetical protein
MYPTRHTQKAQGTRLTHCKQGYHNLTTANHVLPDPELTQLGEQQCAKLKETFPYHSQIELVAASPLRRTIHTALLSFQPVFEAHKDFKILCIPEAQETSDVPCDTGSDPAVLQKEFVDRGLPVDISLVHDGWNSKVFFCLHILLKIRGADCRI